MIGKGDGLHDVGWVMSTLQEHRHDNAAVCILTGKLGVNH